MPDPGPFIAFLAALVFLAAAASLLLVTLRAAQFRAEEDQFPSPPTISPSPIMRTALLSADDLTLSADAVPALCSFGLPVAVLVIACAIAWAVQPGLSSGRA